MENHTTSHVFVIERTAKASSPQLSPTKPFPQTHFPLTHLPKYSHPSGPLHAYFGEGGGGGGGAGVGASGGGVGGKVLPGTVPETLSL